MFKKILVDLEAVIDMPRPFWVRCRSLEEQARILEDEAKELAEFIRDHRSKDGYGIEVRRKFETRCSFCGTEEDAALDSDGVPGCCQKAIDEYNAAKAAVLEKEPVKPC